MDNEKMEYVMPTDAQKAAQRKRSIAIGLGLAGFCALAFVVTLIRIHENINAAIS
ncbi:MAG: hypothetical protein COA84_14325 [Robiginitomaculum sp.]|nr:MAG: hypothetical protein COA84_14325 [Robiginitomaculum sp.]